MSSRIAVIGAGLAGLRCAELLCDAGFDAHVYERENRVGGRMATDSIDGFLVDHGFHVMQTAYPTSKRTFDFTQLGAKAFEPGAIVVQQRSSKPKFWRLADPFRRPFQGVASGLNRFASPFDLLRVARLRFSAGKGAIETVYDGGNDSTSAYLSKRGFSSSMVDRFFHPLFSGIFLEDELKTNERMFRFVFRMMSKGDMVLPRNGIQAAPESVAQRIGYDRIHLSSKVEVRDDNTLLINGKEHSFAAVVHAYTTSPAENDRHVWTLHFDAQHSPLGSNHILLNGDVKLKKQLIAHVAVPSDIQPSYAPEGRSLVTVTVVGSNADSLGFSTRDDVLSQVQTELASWFGEQSSEWRCLAVQHIRHALPEPLDDLGDTPLLGIDRFECGDHMMHGSAEGALLSAEHTAQAVIQSLRQ